MYNKLRDIPQFPFASYQVNMGWTGIESWIEENRKAVGIYELDMNPLYQRGYVWTQDQKERYIEYRLRGGFSGRDIYWNCPGWASHTNVKNPVLELVDGKQRIDAVIGFLNNKVKAFSKYYSEYEDKLSFMKVDFIFHINNLETRKDVLEWYIGLNRGGSAHTDKDLEPAYSLLREVNS